MKLSFLLFALPLLLVMAGNGRGGQLPDTNIGNGGSESSGGLTPPLKSPVHQSKRPGIRPETVARELELLRAMKKRHKQAYGELSVFGCEPYEAHGYTTAWMHPQGDKVIALKQNQTIEVVDLKTGKTLRSWPTGYKAKFLLSAVSPDGSRIATGGATSDIKVWDVDKGKLIKTIAVEDGLRSLTFHADNRSLFAGFVVLFPNSPTREVVRFNSTTGKVLQILHKTSKSSLCPEITVSQNGELVASVHRAFTKGEECSVRVWDKTGKLIRTITYQGDRKPWRARFISPTELLIGGGRRRKAFIFEIVNLDSGMRKQLELGEKLIEEIHVVVVSPDGKTAIIGTVHSWQRYVVSLPGGKEIGKFPVGLGHVRPNFSPAGTMLLSVTMNRQPFIIDMAAVIEQRKEKMK